MTEQPTAQTATAADAADEVRATDTQAIKTEAGENQPAGQPASTVSEPSTSLPEIFDVEEAMRDVVDPELGINVVDLGLVYGIEITDDAVAKIDMTLTSAACPLTDVIEDQSRAALIGSGLCTELEINWVWLPPWGPDKITDDGREQLRALGFTV